MSYHSILDEYTCPNKNCEAGIVCEMVAVDCVVCGGDGDGCGPCKGRGKNYRAVWDTCPDCGGSGYVEEPLMEIGENQMKLPI